MIKKVDAFIFDLDGVITDTAEFHYLAWKELAKSLGISIDREFNETLKGVSRMDSLERILELGNKQNDYIMEEKEKLSIHKNDAYVKLIQNISPTDLLPNVENFLRSLKEANIKIAMASASKNAMMVSKLLKVERYFDHIVDASTVALSKPNPEVFLKAAKAIEVNPENCIGVEDAAAGVVAIKSANMYAVAIGDASVLADADLILESTKELNLKNILDKYNS